MVAFRVRTQTFALAAGIFALKRGFYVCIM